MVHDAHVLILHFHVSIFGAGWWGEMALFLFFSAVWHKEALHRLGI
jgi:hypothetical protein